MGEGLLWLGRVISILAALMLLLDAAGKFTKAPQVVVAFTRLGIPISAAFLTDWLLTLSTVLNAIPRSLASWVSAT